MAIDAAEAPSWLRDGPASQTLRQVWLQNYQGMFRWRTSDEIPPAHQCMGSPYDRDARYSQNRSTQWVEYKVHLSESCDADLPHLMTNVEIRLDTPQDAVTPQIHAALAQRVTSSPE